MRFSTPPTRQRASGLVLALLSIALIGSTVAVGAEGRVTSASDDDRGLLSLAADPTAAPAGTMLSVEVHADDLGAAAVAVDSIGGRVTGEVPGWFVEASVPIGRLADLEADAAVTRVAEITSVVRTPDHVSFQAGESLVRTVEDTLQMSPWHAAGHTGAGQRIGILDVFGAAEFANARNNGRLPAPAGTFCLNNGEACSFTTDRSVAHGVGVAEIIHRAAPDAELYLATVLTTADLSRAIDWFISRGVTIVNRSETSVLDGPGDGTGPVNSIIDRAVAADIVFVSAGGNSGGGGGFQGQNWVGTFNDPDANGVHNWQNGTELMAFECGFILGMRWDDWDQQSIATDYDLWIFDDFDDDLPERRANDPQDSATDPPLEQVETVCNFLGDVDYFAIVRFADIQPDGNDQIQILGNFTPMEEWVNAFSATGPGADSGNPGAITVGATVRPSSFALATYSSQGPTFDGRFNPDLVGPSCLPVTNFVGCFTGTSASAPFVAGALAVLRSAGVFDAATEVDALLPALTVDQGVPGPDNEYGHGAFSMPAPADLGVLSTDQLCFGLVPTILGTDGSDVIRGTDGPDVILAGDGNDRIFAGGGADVICGGPGRDRIKAGRGADQIDSGDQRDRIWGEAGADTIIGGTGGDRIVGNNGNDTIEAKGGPDRAKGGPGDDQVLGGSGDDQLEGDEGADTINGGNGVDACAGNVIDAAADAGDRLTRCE